MKVRKKFAIPKNERRCFTVSVAGHSTTTVNLSVLTVSNFALSHTLHYHTLCTITHFALSHTLHYHTLCMFLYQEVSEECSSEECWLFHDPNARGTTIMRWVGR